MQVSDLFHVRASIDAPSHICVRKYCFFKSKLFARILHSKCSRSLSRASSGSSQDVIKYNWGVLTAITIMENAF